MQRKLKAKPKASQPVPYLVRWSPTQIATVRRLLKAKKVELNKDSDRHKEYLIKCNEILFEAFMIGIKQIKK